MGCNIPYTKEQREWAKNYFSTHSLKETTLAFNERYKLDKKETAIHHIVVGVKPRNHYTIEMLNFLKEMADIPNNTWKYITQEFNKRFNTTTKWTALRRFASGHNIYTITNRDYNFTYYPKHRLKIGTEKIRRKLDGEQYIVVKVDSKHKGNKTNWKLKHYIEWKKYNGRVPENCVLIFLDGNTLNCDISNLMCFDKATLKRVLGNRYTPNYYGKGKITEAYVECIKLEKIIERTRK